MHSVSLTQNALPTLDLVEGEDINLAGTKGDRVMINQTPGLAWEGPYGNGLRSSRRGSGIAGGRVEVPPAEGRTLRNARRYLVSTASGYKDWLAHI